MIDSLKELSLSEEKAIRERVLERIANETANDFKRVMQTHDPASMPKEIVLFGPEPTDLATCNDYLITQLTSRGLKEIPIRTSNQRNGVYSVNVEHYYKKYFPEAVVNFKRKG